MRHEPVIFLDMDGVLVDFVGGAYQLHGKPNPYTDPNRTDAACQWGLEGLISLSPEQFWAPLGYEFWANLKWTADGRRILMAAEAVASPDRVCLLSTPCDTRGCSDGKREWVKREMPDYVGRLFLGKHKAALSRPGAVLIDDSDVNCREWKDRGGLGILVPRPWNSLHTKLAKGPDWPAREVASALSAYCWANQEQLKAA